MKKTLLWLPILTTFLVLIINLFIFLKNLQEKNINFDLSQINEEVFKKYNWTVDQMLENKIGGEFKTLKSTIFKIIRYNFKKINIIKINVDIYYGEHKIHNLDYLINFDLTKNLLPITYFSIHITPKNYFYYKNEKWITINTNVDLTELNILKNSELFYLDNPKNYSSIELMDNFIKNINKILQTKEGYEEIIKYYKNKKMWNDNIPLPFGYFNLTVDNKEENNKFIKLDYLSSMLIFDPTDIKNNYKIILESKGFGFYKKSNFLSVWNIIVSYNDFNFKDWRNINWKFIREKKYDGNTTIEEVFSDVIDYLVYRISFVHTSYFVKPTDIEIILKKEAKLNDDDIWPLTTKLKDLLKNKYSKKNPYVFALLKKSNKNYIKFSSKFGIIGTYISFKIF